MYYPSSVSLSATAGVLSTLFPSLASALPAATEFLAHRNVVEPLEQKATVADRFYQPALDFDMDSCYNVAAIDAHGNINAGLGHDNTGGSDVCRTSERLLKGQVYSRQRCNNGHCVYIYDYYFEKDVAIEYGLDAGGHTHEWEHVAVWVQQDSSVLSPKAMVKPPEGGPPPGVVAVAVSSHGRYNIQAAKDVRWDGPHVKVVYHKEGGSTHAFRFGKPDDDEQVENHLMKWFRGKLLSYAGYDQGLRDKLGSYDFGKATMAVSDSQFPTNIRLSKPWEIFFDEMSDANGSPGDPNNATDTDRYPEWDDFYGQTVGYVPQPFIMPDSSS